MPSQRVWAWRILFPPPQKANEEKGESECIDQNIHPDLPRNDIKPLQKMMHGDEQHGHADPFQEVSNGISARFEQELPDMIVDVVPHRPIRTGKVRTFKRAYLI